MGIRTSGAAFEVARTTAKGSHAKTRRQETNCDVLEIFSFFGVSSVCIFGFVCFIT